jgi:5-methylcytosine-specific restriction enzyme A
VPMMPARRCPSCRQLVTGRRCQACVRQADQRRGTAHERGFTSQWAGFSTAWRNRYPLCGERADGRLYAEHSRCVQQGLEVPAECVDHIDGHSRPDDRETFYDPRRLQSLCLDCNRVKGIRHEGGLGRPKTGAARRLDLSSAPNHSGGIYSLGHKSEGR